MNGKRLLIVEDDPDLREMLKVNFTDEGFVCDTAADGEEGLTLAKGGMYALVVLDRILPKRNGTDVLTELRRAGAFVPVVFLTSKSEDADKIVGLELGADDYVTKPFQFGELNARVRAVLRRSEITGYSVAEGKHALLSFGRLAIDTRTRKVAVGDRTVRLTALEYDLLLFLIGHTGVPQTREQILEAVWQTTFLGYEDSVNTAVKRLRKKIEDDPASPEFIHTLRNVGYVFRPGGEPE